MATSEFATMVRSAQSDLRALQHMPDAFAFDERVFGFHAQQACEKALKAWLLTFGQNPPFSHDLRELIQLLGDEGVMVPEAEALVALTKYAVQWRYGDIPPDRLIDRARTVSLCERLLNRAIDAATASESEAIDQTAMTLDDSGLARSKQAYEEAMAKFVVADPKRKPEKA